MRNILGNILIIAGYILGGIAFLYDLFCAYNIMGFIGIVLGVFIFPALLIAVPFYMIFKYGIWVSMVLTITSIVLFVIGALTHKDTD